MSGTEISLSCPGIVEYERAWQWQREWAGALRAGSSGECFALLQHPPVFTLGRSGHREHLLVSEPDLARRGACVVDVDRGGDVTFHGPGQVVGYPILDLRRRALSPVDYVRSLEQVIIDALAAFGIIGERVPGRPGVWAGGGKIAAIGVRVQGGVTTHGFALNVSTDLTWFDAIIPCGLRDVTVTSVHALGGGASVTDMEGAIVAAFAERFDAVLVSSSSLDLAWAQASAEVTAVGR
jgi:lipoyl(octanoyl) transferase